MKTFKARPAAPSDSQNYLDWLKAAADINLVDFNVYSYPCCNTLAIDADGEPVLMTSTHPVLVIEALAPKPGVAPRDEAMALRKLYEAIREIATATGIAEVWFQCTDERLEKFIIRKGFVKATAPLFKMKIAGNADPLNKPRPEGKK